MAKIFHPLQWTDLKMRLCSCPHDFFALFDGLIWSAEERKKNNNMKKTLMTEEETAFCSIILLLVIKVYREIITL